MAFFILGVSGPVLAQDNLGPSSLVEAIREDVSLVRSPANFVETRRVLTSNDRLPSNLCTPYQRRRVVVSVMFVGLQPLADVVRVIVAIVCGNDQSRSFHTLDVRFDRTCREVSL